MICLSLYGNTDEIREAIIASDDADLFEIRLDLSPSVDAAAIRSATTKPLIFTAHGKPHLLPAVKSFADYIDVGQGPAIGAGSIRSIHAQEAEPVKLLDQLDSDAIRKIVLETQNYDTIHSLLRLNRAYSSRVLCFASGEVGAFSRILSVFWGAPWIYASLQDRATGAGQFSLQELIHTYRIRRHASNPTVFGIIGDPIGHSRSPEFHNRRFAEAGLPWIYLPFLCKDLTALMSHAPDFGVSGFSITHPYKEAILPLVQKPSAEVLQLRSCNTVCRKGDEWHGINTDVAGAMALMEQSHIPIPESRVVILGAGGSARTIASVVAPLAKKLIILNRTKEKADALAAEYHAGSGTLRDLAVCEYDILFQATSVGLGAADCPVDPAHLRPGTTVVDLIYEPPKTLLLQKAEALGCRIINGETWFDAQAEAQFQWWRSLISD